MPTKSRTPAIPKLSQDRGAHSLRHGLVKGSKLAGSSLSMAPFPVLHSIWWHLLFIGYPEKAPPPCATRGVTKSDKLRATFQAFNRFYGGGGGGVVVNSKHSVCSRAQGASFRWNLRVTSIGNGILLHTGELLEQDPRNSGQIAKAEAAER